MSAVTAVLVQVVTQQTTQLILHDTCLLTAEKAPQRTQRGAEDHATYRREPPSWRRPCCCCASSRGRLVVPLPFLIVLRLVSSVITARRRWGVLLSAWSTSCTTPCLIRKRPIHVYILASSVDAKKASCHIAEGSWGRWWWRGRASTRPMQRTTAALRVRRRQRRQRRCGGGRGLPFPERRCPISSRLAITAATTAFSTSTRTGGRGVPATSSGDAVRAAVDGKKSVCTCHAALVRRLCRNRERARSVEKPSQGDILTKRDGWCRGGRCGVGVVLLVTYRACSMRFRLRLALRGSERLVRLPRARVLLACEMERVGLRRDLAACCGTGGGASRRGRHLLHVTVPRRRRRWWWREARRRR